LQGDEELQGRNEADQTFGGEKPEVVTVRVLLQEMNMGNMLQNISEKWSIDKFLVTLRRNYKT